MSGEDNLGRTSHHLEFQCFLWKSFPTAKSPGCNEWSGSEAIESVELRRLNRVRERLMQEVDVAFSHIVVMCVAAL